MSISVRRRGRKRKAPGDTAIDLSSSRMEEMLSWHVHICSENNFPTAAGLASSAAGYACLGKFSFQHKPQETKYVMRQVYCPGQTGKPYNPQTLLMSVQASTLFSELTNHARQVVNDYYLPDMIFDLPEISYNIC